jgi:hypothetical protein
MATLIVMATLIALATLIVMATLIVNHSPIDRLTLTDLVTGAADWPFAPPWSRCWASKTRRILRGCIELSR